MEVYEVKRQLHQPTYGNRPVSRSPSPPPSPPADSYRALTPSPPPPRPVPPSPPVPTHPVAPTAPEPSGPQSLHPCNVCGRTFLPQSLAKHAKICEKMTVKKRKTFDSSRQRREGTDLASFLPKNFGLPENSPFIEKSPPNTAKAPPKKTQSVRSAKSKPAPELSKCPHCARAFGLRAFERHVEWCADKAKILPAAPANPPQHVADARHRLAARTQYKAPLARSRRSLTRDKGSNSRSTSVDSASVRGESPPPPPAHPPRDAGDFRYRSRTSAGSSVECLEDAPSPHVPVIRHGRRGAVEQVGDAARARHARLAKDLHSNRISDDYDPFASAARQMRELMSSDTNIPKKLQSTPKDSTKTLPYIRSSKEKSPPYYSRSNYSKSINDAMKKQNQNNPTLHRMKSFDNSNSDYSRVNTFGGRASSFRVSKNDAKSSPKINTTFTKSSKENINTSPFSRTSSLNRSFSSYTSNVSTNKNRDTSVSMTSSLNHSIQRTVKPPNKFEKITKTPMKTNFVNLDVILVDDNSSTTTDSHYIDPRLINETDNLPINVHTILNNPGIISSLESLLNTENLPSKFETLKVQDNKHFNNNKDKTDKENNFKNTLTTSNTDIAKTKSTSSLTPTIDDLSVQYDKIMTSLEQSIASKVSVRDDDSLCEDFDLEEFMTSFDEELNKQRAEKRSYSSTTRVVKNFNVSSHETSQNSIDSSPKTTNGNDLIPFNKSNSMNFSSSRITDSVFPSSVKRSTSLLDTLPKKATPCKSEGKKSKGYKTEESKLEQDIIQSLKEFDQFYENGPVEDWMGNKVESRSHSRRLSEKSDTTKKESRSKDKYKYEDEQNLNNNNGTSNGKINNDSAYSSLNGISPSKLNVAKEQKCETVITPPPNGSDSSGSHKDELRAMSSDEFLALERSAEALDAPLERSRHDKEIESYKMDLEKRVSGGRRTPPWRSRADLSSSGSDCSLVAARAPPAPPAPPAARLSRFCHECGGRFHIHTAKFCTECGAKRIAV